MKSKLDVWLITSALGYSGVNSRIQDGSSMPESEKHYDSSDRLESIQLLSKPLRTSLEETVSGYLKRDWRVKSARDMSEFACHQCAILSDDSFSVFAKYSEDANAPIQFETELSGLQCLSERAGVMIPSPVGVAPAGKGTLLIMEALEAIERTPVEWRQIGKTLASIHQVKSDRFGFHKDGFHGPLHQDNTPATDWIAFYQDRRLLPRLKIAINSGNLPSKSASQVEKVVDRLPELCDPDVTPALLHGDTQQNNFISTGKGTYVIDPAVFYGNPEYDLAFIDCFQPVPDCVFDAYREEMPIDPGFRERRNLWRISIYLAAVALEGEMYLGMLTDAIREYL